MEINEEPVAEIDGDQLVEDIVAGMSTGLELVSQRGIAYN